MSAVPLPPDREADGVTAVDAAGLDRHAFRSFDLVMAAFVAVLLLSNVIGAAKLADIGGWEFGAGILFFPISYVLGDVLTEVYGYARARRVIWVGFAALLFLAVMSLAVVAMPPSDGWWTTRRRGSRSTADARRTGRAGPCGRRCRSRSSPRR